MRANPLRRRFAEGKLIRNGWLSLASSYGAEIAGHAFDAVTVDLQHGMLGIDAAIPMLQALSATPAVPLARPTASNAPEIMKLLDAGAYGVICPQVDTPEIAAHVVAACRYPPTGMRSSGAARALLYGGDDYVTHANAEVLVLAMIESRQALERLDEILDTRGLDGLFIGPYDLSMSLGEAAPPAQSPRVEDAIARVLAAGRQRGLLCGIFCPSVDVAVQRAAQGFHLVTPMNDAGALRAAYASACARLGPTG